MSRLLPLKMYTKSGRNLRLRHFLVKTGPRIINITRRIPILLLF